MGSAKSKNVGEQTTEAPPVVKVVEGVAATKNQNHNEPIMEHPEPTQLDESRLLDLMHALKHIAGLQRAASNAQIDARQKRRRVGFLQQDVGNRDATFMKEVQKLIAQGRLKGFEDLLMLADKCRDARDQLGPLERGSMEAEQAWEGQLWKLQQAEERLYEGFSSEFQIAESYHARSASPASDGTSSGVPSVAPSSASSGAFSLALAGRADPESSSGKERLNTEEITTPIINFYASYAGSASSASIFLFSPPPTPPAVEMPQSLMLEAVGTHEAVEVATSSCHESITLDIDQVPDDTARDDIAGLRQPLPTRQPQGPYLYPELRTDFKNKRDMMNKWIEHITLESHLHSTLLYGILQKTLEEEEKIKPSNWSQLVIAYWHRDDAAIPQNQQNTGYDCQPNKSIT